MFDIDIQMLRGAFSLNAQFTASKGITVVTGPSGAGKSSIASALAGFTTPKGGKIVVGSRTLFDSAGKTNIPAAQRRAGYVLQDALLFPHRTVRGNLRYGLRKGAFEFDQVVKLLDLGALLNRRPRTLSGGEQQRVAIGRTLLSQPAFLVMDEPLANLDRDRRNTLMTFFEVLRDRHQLPILYISHNWPEIVRLADTLVLLDQGKTVAQGSIAKVLAGTEASALLPAGMVVTVEVAALMQDGLARLVVGDGAIYAHVGEHVPGDNLRIFIDARDVALALEEPVGLSIQNTLKGTIAQLVATSGGDVEVALVLPDKQLIKARVTSRAVESLQLETGKTVYALIKSVALDRDSVLADTI